MSEVSFFQRFSQKENHATNNSMLLIRHFYQVRPSIVQKVFSKLSDEPIELGLSFAQQVKKGGSIPDAVISQNPLDIYFETKMGGMLDEAQIMRHFASIQSDSKKQSKKILFGLTKTEISQIQRDKLLEEGKNHNVIFAGITFESILQELRGECEPHETTLHAILDDYESYLESAELIQKGQILRVVPCGTSMSENVEFELYFEPTNRASKARSDYIGLYKQKQVKYLCEIGTVVNGCLRGGEFIITSTEMGKISEEERERILKAIEACHYYEDLAHQEFRYYLFNTVAKTEINKVSAGGIWGARRFNLSDWLSYDKVGFTYETAEAAELLKGKEFT